MKDNYSTKIVTGKGWLVNPHLLRVNSRTNFENATPKFGTTFAICKDDKETLAKIDSAINLAIKQGGFSDGVKLMLPLKDGDVNYPGETLYKNAMYLYASTPFRPTVVDHKLQEDKFRVNEYSFGTYAKLSIEFVPYHFNEKCGISVRLINVQVFPQNKLLESRSKPEDDFIVEEVDTDE